MKFFTPALFLELQETKDEPRFLAANDAWEKVVAKYQAQLKTLASELPRPLRRVVEEYRFHDADMLAMDRGPRTLTITLRLDPSTPFLVILTYSLLQEPQINRSALPAQFCSPHPKWLYDEIDTGHAGSDSGQSAFTHNILLSDGWEMLLLFRKLQISKRQAIFPVYGDGPQGSPSSVSQSA